VASNARSLYIDASALVKLVVRERETDALTAFVAGADLVASEIVAIEVPRAAHLSTRAPETIEHAERLLEHLHLLALDDELRQAAARVGPPELRTLDAIHLVSALRVAREVEALVAYDLRLGHAARAAGLRVDTPV
jgi:predicted nucleic acid-binding protein